MGQAKQRGTYEERRALAIAQRAEETRVRRLAHLQRERSMTPDQRMERHEFRQLMVMALAHTVVIGNE